MRLRSALVALACVCAACGSTHGTKPQRVPGEPGFLLQVHGQRMYYECTGHGTPTVLLEAGLGGDVKAWDWVVPGAASTTRTCAYDRVRRRTGRQQVDDLHALLKAAHVEPPYVLVGHSYGGLLVHEYAAAYPEEVAGVVLVDASHPAQVRQFLAALGPPRPHEEPVRRELRSFLQRPTTNSEGVDVQASMAEARRAGRLGSKPLVVITAGRETSPKLPPELKMLLDRTWLRLQADLAHLSTDSIHVIASRSGHDVISPLDQPDVVVKAIRAVVEATRAKRGLPSCRELFAARDVRCVSP